MPRRAQPLQLPETHINLISRAGISLLGLVLLPSCAHIYVYTAKQGLCCPSQHPAQRSGLIMFASKGWTGIAAFFQSKHVPKNLPLRGGCPCNLPGSVTLQATSCCRRCEMFFIRRVMAANEELTTGSCTRPSHFGDIILAKGASQRDHSQPLSACGFQSVSPGHETLLSSLLPD